MKNYGIYIDDVPSYVTTQENIFHKKLEELKAKYPDKKITFTVWYD